MTMTYSVNLIDRVLGVFVGKSIPQSIVQFHRRLYREVSTKAWHVQRIQSQKFDGDEFTRYIRIRRDLNISQGHYKKLKKSVELLELALIVKDSFLLIEETEMRFRSSAQQELYAFIVELLSKSLDRQKVSQLMHLALKKISPKIKTSEGKMVMKEYILAIDGVLKHEFGLELLRSFKESNLHHYTMLCNISKTAKTLKKLDLNDLKRLTILVQENRHDFEELGEIIHVPTEHRVPVSYARMLQYIALKHRYESSSREFSEMIKHLADWEKAFLSLMELRREYTTKNYRNLGEFTQAIPALDIYQKYQKYLEDYRNNFFNPFA